MEMMNFKKISLKILFILIFLMLLSTQVIFAYNDGDKKAYQPVEFSADHENGSGNGEISASGTGDIKTTGGKIVGVIQVVGTIVSVGMIIVLGIKYMMGSAEERAEYKKTLFPYFVGAILIFAAANLAQMIYSWASKI